MLLKPAQPFGCHVEGNDARPREIGRRLADVASAARLGARDGCVLARNVEVTGHLVERRPVLFTGESR
jgi:hypothetical protein